MPTKLIPMKGKMGKIGKKLGEEEGRGRRGEWDRRIIWKGDNMDRNGLKWNNMDRNERGGR